MAKQALAWVINVGIEKQAWLAPCGDQVARPFPLNLAKSAAMAVLKGACGDYFIREPIAHLNGPTARLLETEAA